jgi:lipopolysaccharide transport system permease protein
MSVATGQLKAFPGPPAKARRLITIRPPALTVSGMVRDLRKLVQYRDLLYTLSVHRIKVRYKQSLLGAAWAIVQPLSLMLIYTVIFSLIVKMPTDGTPYAVFSYAALLPWTFFSTALTNATNGLVSHSQLITKVYFPREILPLTYIIASFVDFLIASSVFAGLMMYYHVPLTSRLLYVLPIMLIMVCFVTAISLIFSATQVRFRDIGVAIPLLLQLWMFATPIVYPLSAVPHRLMGFYKLNPMVGLIDSFRQVTLYAATPDLQLLAFSAMLSVGLLALSWCYFKRVEATVADVI